MSNMLKKLTLLQRQVQETGIPYIMQLRDIRVAGQLLFAVIVLLVSWSGVKAIDANYALQKQVSTLQEQNTVQELENNNLQLQNDYYNSPQYLDLSARENFGLAAPGETEVIVPKNVALAYTVPMQAPSSPSPTANMPFFERNFQAWLDFFLHRPPQP